VQQNIRALLNREGWNVGRYLAEVRRDTAEKPLNSFRMSLGSCEVCTTFGKRFQTFRQTEAELAQWGFLFDRRFGNPLEDSGEFLELPCF
jgi:hypothetical protein